MPNRDVIELVAALADAGRRPAALERLAARCSAEALLVFGEEPETATLTPLCGTRSTIPTGPSWRALLMAARTPGVHRRDVTWPGRAAPVQAVAYGSPGLALVFLGPEDAPELADDLLPLLPLLAAMFRAEQRADALNGQLAVAREDAHRAENLAHSLGQVRAVLEQQANTLSEARIEAEGAIRAKDEFLAMLSHELRNPLSPIITGLHLLRMKQGPSHELMVVERQARQLMRLVDDLLDISRITRGKVRLNKVTHELGTTIARAIEMASPMLEEKHQTLDVAVPEQGFLIDGDPDRLAQVFSNLLINAAKYNSRNGRVSVIAEAAPDEVVVRMRDTGIGIAPDMLDRIFTPFTQQSQSLARSGGGLGLGLAIAKNLVELHGGTLRAASDGLGNGSEFAVALPLGPAPALVENERKEPDVSVDAPETTPPARLRLLVVDDNEDAASLLGETLTALGHEVRTAYDGPSALQLAEQFEFDAAVLDIGLPVMDGYELAQRLRARLHPPRRVRFIALTGYAQPADVERSLAAGFDHHLVKPVRVKELQALLHAHDG